MTGILNILAGSIAAAIKDGYFNLVTLLLPGDGTNGAQNNTFLDSSTNNFSITRNGNTTQGTFTPFSQTGWSNYFDGSGDYITVPDSTAFTLGTGDFTIEYWAYVPAYSDMRAYGQVNSVPDGNTISVFGGINGSNKAYSGARVSTTEYACISTNNFPINQWVHHVLVRDGTTLRQYINGVQDGTSTIGTASVNDSSNLFAIGRVGEYNALYWNGYISNFRLVKGTCLYPSGTTFTPPTSPLTAVTNTSYLTCQSNRFVDNSTNAFAITLNGTPSVQAFSPFAPTAAYSAATVGGSAYQDGSGDFLSFATNTSAFQLGSGDWCCEGWIYRVSNTSGFYIMSGQTDQTTIAGSSFYVGLGADTCSAFSGGSRIDLSAGTINRYEWTHIAFCRTGSTVSVFKSGTRAATGTFSGTINNGSTTYPPKIGASGSSTGTEQYLSGVRIVIGSSPYNAASTSITVPTAPITAITNTALLCNFTNAGITDATAKNDLETVGNAQISTTQSKFGGSSMYFDGNGDYLNFPSSQLFGFGTGDFTIEFWLYLNTVSGTQNLCDFRNAATTEVAITLYMNGASPRLYVNGADRITGGNLSTGQWYHVALARSGTSTKLFVDGTQSGSTYTDSNNYLTPRPLRIGTTNDGTPQFPLNAYVDDFRITRYARYTANFSAPTAAFQLS